MVADLDAVDLRPGGPAPARASATLIVSGPDDLKELRAIVETATGVGSWPRSPAAPGEVRTATMPLVRPGAALGLLLAMEGLIDDRSPWRTWRTAVDTLAPAVGALDTLTIEAVIVDPGG